MKKLNIYTTAFFLILSISFLSFNTINLEHIEDAFADVNISVTNGLANQGGCDGSLPIPCDSKLMIPNTMLPASASLAKIRISKLDKIEMEFMKSQINPVMLRQLKKSTFSFYSDFLIDDQGILNELDPTANILLLKKGNYSVTEKTNSYLVTINYVKY